MFHQHRDPLTRENPTHDSDRSPRLGGEATEHAEERAAEAKRAAEERRRLLAQVGEALIAAKRAVGNPE